MSDSISIRVDISGLNINNEQQEALPLKRKTVTNQFGEILRSDPVGYKVQSPLNKAHYYIEPIFDGGMNRRVVVTGYIVEANMPACTVGNNVLNQNLVWTAAKFAVLFLKLFLQRNGCPSSLTDRITMDLVTIEEVTLTFLFDCGSHAAALDLNDEFYRHGDAVLNAHPVAGKQPVFRVGNGKDSTTYCKHKEFELIGYVKASKTKKAFCDLKGQAAIDVYAVGQGCFRFETKLKAGYLKKHGLDKPEAWKIARGGNPHCVGIELARRHLRLDEDLRTVRPKPAYIAKLSANDQTILTSHLAGNDVLHHTLIGTNQHQFGMYRARILKATRVDIAIPWLVQSQQISSLLADTLVVDGQFKLPQHLQPLSFFTKTAKALYSHLQARVSGAAPVAPSSVSPVLNPTPPKLTEAAASAVVARVRGTTLPPQVHQPKLGLSNIRKRLKK